MEMRVRTRHNSSTRQAQGVKESSSPHHLQCCWCPNDASAVSMVQAADGFQLLWLLCPLVVFIQQTKTNTEVFPVLLCYCYPGLYIVVQLGKPVSLSCCQVDEFGAGDGVAPCRAHHHLDLCGISAVWRDGWQEEWPGQSCSEAQFSTKWWHSMWGSVIFPRLGRVYTETA